MGAGSIRSHRASCRPSEHPVAAAMFVTGVLLRGPCFELRWCSLSSGGAARHRIPPPLLPATEYDALLESVHQSLLTFLFFFPSSLPLLIFFFPLKDRRHTFYTYTTTYASINAFGNHCHAQRGCRQQQDNVDGYVASNNPPQPSFIDNSRTLMGHQQCPRYYLVYADARTFR